MTAETPLETPLITAFLQAMSADRGLARNSLDAYRRDLEAASSALLANGTSLAVSQEPLTSESKVINI